MREPCEAPSAPFRFIGGRPGRRQAGELRFAAPLLLSAAMRLGLAFALPFGLDAGVDLVLCSLGPAHYGFVIAASSFCQWGPFRMASLPEESRPDAPL
ncbi:MAG: hypothetical protein A2W04_05000 [Betaproteobacteria bacterium RBG_16_64_9]|nr:MAG: hypothetical protein A2W04_05000 [Betaproteobacteria bacterium RBG_16_64_9]